MKKNNRTERYQFKVVRLRITNEMDRHIQYIQDSLGVTYNAAIQLALYHGLKKMSKLSPDELIQRSELNAVVDNESD